MYVGGSVNPAPIYRVINKWRGTAIFDEFTLKESDESTDIIQILNNGFQRGKPVLRCKDHNYSDVESFDPFCPKILACRQQFKDMALESRCITEIIKETTRDDIPTDLGATFKQERQELQNKLLLYRLKNWNKVIPDEKLCFNFGRIQPRIKQTFLPFTVLFQYDQFILDGFIETVKSYNTKLTEENSSSYDGLILNGYLTLLNNSMPVITTQDIRNILVNDHGYEAEKTNARTVGKHMKTLGFTSVSKWMGKDEKAKRVVDIDLHTVKRLIYRYVDTKDQENMVALVEKNKAQTKIGGE